MSSLRISHEHLLCPKVMVEKLYTKFPRHDRLAATILPFWHDKVQQPLS